jgi:hypothetical protein
MGRLCSVFAAPLICLIILGGIALADRGHATGASGDAFHARAKSAIQSVPYSIGQWVGNDVAVPTAAVALLKPNCILSRRYVTPPDVVDDEPIAANLLIVQCRDSRDMAGHYPPNCYPAAGMRAISSGRFSMAVGTIAVHGMEYHFAAPSAGGALTEGGFDTQCVYDFFVVPGKGIVADIGGVRASAADRDHRQFGAAQIQLVISDRYSQTQREKALADLLGKDEPLLRTLTRDE